MGTHFKLCHILGSSSNSLYSFPYIPFIVSSEKLVLNQHISEMTIIFLLVICLLENASNS